MESTIYLLSIPSAIASNLVCVFPSAYKGHEIFPELDLWYLSDAGHAFEHWVRDGGVR
jgi:hypothetical protein